MSGTKRQRDKKNKYRPSAGEVGFKVSAKSNKKRAIINPNEKSLFA